jgi:outer membrane lipoprotein carrier protein
MKYKLPLLSVLLCCLCMGAHADAVDALKDFVREVKSGRAQFTQTVTSPDGARKKTSGGSFEFVRPNRFRFAYTQPYEQLIVGDGQKVWIFDADLNQASSRKFSQALGNTPAALLAGGALDKDFDLTKQPSKDGLDWVLATPKTKDSSFQAMAVGFKGKDLVTVDILDSFGQRSVLQFTGLVPNAVLPIERFQFKPPPGADVIEQ